MNELEKLRAELERRIAKAEAQGIEVSDEDREATLRDLSGGKFGLADLSAAPGKVLPNYDTNPGVRNLGRSFAQGLTFNFADELMGLLKGPEARDEMRARDAAFKAAHPGYDMAAQMAGGIAVPGLGAGTALRAGAPMAKAMVTGGALGGASAALAGAGAGETMQERGDNVLSGQTGLGAILGAAIPGAVGAARLAGSTSARAQRRLQHAIDKSGGVDAVRAANARFAAAGRTQEPMLADLTDRLRAEADFAVNASDDALVDIAQKHKARQVNQSERLLSDVRLQVGDPIAPQRIEELAQETRQWADPAYDALRASTPQMPPQAVRELAPIITQPHVKSALAKAMEEGLIGRVPDKGAPSYQHIRDTVKSLKARADVAFRAGNTELGTRLMEARNDLDAVLQRHVPGYKATNAEYARRKGLEFAVEQGVEQWDMVDTRGLRSLLSNLSAEEVVEFRKGIASQLITKLRSAATNRDVAKQLLDGSKAMQEKLEVVFGNKAGFEKFMRAAEMEAQMSKMAGPLGGSATARRLAAQGFDPLELGVDMATGGAGNALARFVAKQTTGRVNRGTAAKLAPFLSIQGSQAIEEFLNSLTQQPLKRAVGPFAGGMAPVALGGLLGSQR